MPRKRFRPEVIIPKSREAEVLISQGHTMALVCRSLDVTDQTHYRWRKEYGGMKLDQAERLKELEIENSRLKKLVADLSLKNSALEEVSRGNF